MQSPREQITNSTTQILEPHSHSPSFSRSRLSNRLYLTVFVYTQPRPLKIHRTFSVKKKWRRKKNAKHNRKIKAILSIECSASRTQGETPEEGATWYARCIKSTQKYFVYSQHYKYIKKREVYRIIPDRALYMCVVGLCQRYICLLLVHDGAIIC